MIRSLGHAELAAPLNGRKRDSGISRTGITLTLQHGGPLLAGLQSPGCLPLERAGLRKKNDEMSKMTSCQETTRCR
jgi:hypothetical protein